jgi:hypothetical protein
LRKIKIYLIGGFGNVLFQLNYGDFLEKKGFKIEYCDILLRKNIFTSLFRWSIHKTFLDLEELDFHNEYTFTSFNVFDLVLIILSRIIRAPIFGVEFCKHALMSSNHKSNVICGYFMLNVPVSEKLVNKLREALIDFSVHNDSEKLIVHYRGGDYADGHFPRLDNYYKKTLSMLDREYYVVTNDKVLAHRIFSSDANFLGFKTSLSALGDFSLLASASILVQSSSTFSWWAAEISRADAIYQPEPYFNHIDWIPQSKLKNRIGIRYEA